MGTIPSYPAVQTLTDDVLVPVFKDGAQAVATVGAIAKVSTDAVTALTEAAAGSAADAAETVGQIVGLTDDIATNTDAAASLTGLTGGARTFSDRLRGIFGHSRRFRLPTVLDPEGHTGFAMGADGPVFRSRVKPRRPDERTPRGLWGAGPRGQQAFAVRSDGTTSMRPARDTAARVHLPISAIRGSYRKRDAWPYARGLNAVSIQEPDGTLTTGVQRTDGRFDTVAAVHGSDDTAPALMVLVLGQSQVGLSGDGAALIQTRLFPHHVLATNVLAAFGVYGDAAAGNTVQPHWFEDLYPFSDTAGTTTMFGATVPALEAFNRLNGRPSPGYVGTYVWRGGTPISWFLKGSTAQSPAGFIYNQVLAVAQGFTTLMKRKYGRSVRPIILWDQGDSGEGPRASYAAALGGLLTNLSADISAICGLAPRFFLTQPGNSQGGDVTGEEGTGPAMLDVAASRTDTWVLGPVYQSQVRPESGPTDPTNTHRNNVGRYTIGEAQAYGIQQVIDTGHWQPLQPNYAGIARTNAQIVIPYLRPAGGTGLQFDDAWVPPSVGAVRGFTAYLVSSGAKLAIASVAIDGANVVITLSANPGGPVRVKYAEGLTDAQSLWVANRGQLFCASPISSFYYPKGVALFPALRFYACRDDFTTP